MTCFGAPPPLTYMFARGGAALTLTATFSIHVVDSNQGSVSRYGSAAFAFGSVFHVP